MMVTTRSGSTYEVREDGLGRLEGYRVEATHPRSVVLPVDHEFCTLASDRVLIGERMFFVNGVVTTTVTGVE